MIHLPTDHQPITKPQIIKRPSRTPHNNYSPNIKPHLSQAMSTSSATVRQISECFIRPKYTELDEKKPPIYFTPWDYMMLSVHYIQKGLLFSKPAPPDRENSTTDDFLDKLRDSLARTLVHYYPLAGRLVTEKSEDPHSYVVYVDPNNGPGARFIHASADFSVRDVLLPKYVPQIVQSFFDHDRAIDHDGHFLSLLTVQVTELTDGIFVGCSVNHSVADGTSYWNFFNAWSEMFRTGDISCPPALEKWFPEGHGPKISLPYTHHDQFVGRYESPLLNERIFHFSSESLAKLKAKANSEQNTNKISTFQALSALVWRCITRTRGLPADQVTSCRVAANNRARLNPKLPEMYFGNCIQPLRTYTTAGELLQNSLGWAAWKVHEAVIEQNDARIRGLLDSWIKSPAVFQLGQAFDPYSVMMGSSPRFNKYGIEFGLGKALALRSGYGNKFSGKVTGYPGREGGGSVDLEVCLPPESMSALEADREFMDAVSKDMAI